MLPFTSTSSSLTQRLEQLVNVNHNATTHVYPFLKCKFRRAWIPCYVTIDSEIPSQNVLGLQTFSSHVIQKNLLNDHVPLLDTGWRYHEEQRGYVARCVAVDLGRREVMDCGREDPAESGNRLHSFLHYCHFPHSSICDVRKDVGSGWPHVVCKGSI